MTTSPLRRNLFTIAPGTPFLKNFVIAFLSGQILPSISYAATPFTIARTKIYVPTRRAAQALKEQFEQNRLSSALLLPQILPLGGLNEHASEDLFAGNKGNSFDHFPTSISELERRFILAELILAWSKSIQHAIVSISQEGQTTYDSREPFLVTSTPSAAYLLARELARLIDEFNIEDIDPEHLKKIVEDSFDPYWSITTRFLDIALTQWPKILSRRQLMDETNRRKKITEALACVLERDKFQPPIIAIGSTGAQPATARLLTVISALENGAVIFPGLDQEMSETSWDCLGQAQDETSFSHPQIMLKKLLELMGVARDEVKKIGGVSPELSARESILSVAMASAPQTAHWRDFCKESQDLFQTGLAGVSYIEAPDERLESLTLALFMREALDQPDKTALLITPDRNIARRVAQDLMRYNIAIDDSGGVVFAVMPVGVLSTLICDIFIDGLTELNLSALLTHELCAIGMRREEIERLRPLIEIAVLRIKKSSNSDWLQHLILARQRAISHQSYPSAQRIDAKQWEDIQEIFLKIQSIFAHGKDLTALSPLNYCAKIHKEIFHALISNTHYEAYEEIEILDGILDQLIKVETISPIGTANYRVIFHSIVHETMFRRKNKSHPRLQILGPLEARLMDADLVLLAGLDEGVWPPQIETGVFLNRSMRQQLGMSSPERRIGQSAHDFMMALGAAEVVLSRSRKRNGSPTVASRFITRIEALSGEAFNACRERGLKMQNIALRLDEPEALISLEPPRPAPALSLRPKQLSVTRIEQLRRDPYAIYAESILKLKPLAPLGARQGAREIGTSIHLAISKFIHLYPQSLLTEQMWQELIEIAKVELADFFEDPEFVGFTWPRLIAGLDYFFNFDRERRNQAISIFQEIKGSWCFKLKDASDFTITAQADRIEVDQENLAYVFDYKTGRVPTNAQVKAGWSPQLTLEAAMVEAGAFKDIGAKGVSRAAYIGLKAGGKTQWLDWKGQEDFAEIVARHRSEVIELLSQFRDEATPYLSRPYVFLNSDVSDYDYLARVLEWSRSGGDEG
jgi:ATP-dependent helicase/nuclease subunit B